MQARDAVKPTILDEEEHARYLAALISGDAAAVRATEEQSAIIRQGGAPWIDGERRIWVRMPAWDHGGRSLLSDEAIQARIEGRPGPFKIEISKMTGRSVLFGFVYSLRVNPLSAWGRLMVFRQRDMQAFARTRQTGTPSPSYSRTKRLATLGQVAYGRSRRSSTRCGICLKVREARTKTAAVAGV